MIESARQQRLKKSFNRQKRGGGYIYIITTFCYKKGVGVNMYSDDFNKDNEEIVNITSETISETEGEESPKEKMNWIKELRDWVVAIAIAVVVALVVRQYVFTLVKVQGQSMEPSLHNNDRLYVNRFFYTPEKGDVVIFKPASDPNRPYIKRVIATEGDTIYIDFRTGSVYVNDELIKEDYINGPTREVGTYIASLIKDDNYSKDNPIVIQPGYIFAMGDNRNNSKDSRHIGPVPVKEIMGGAIFRFWPVSDVGTMHINAEQVSFMINTDGETGLY